MAVSLGDFDVGGEIFRDRIRERDFTALDHVGEQKGGERFRHRADLENGVAIQRSRISSVAMAERDDPFSVRFDYAENYADVIFVRANSLDQDLPNLIIRREHAMNSGDTRRCACQDRHRHECSLEIFHEASALLTLRCGK